MSKGKRILEILTDENPNAIMYDDMDEALIGIYRGTSNGQGGTYEEDAIAVYSYVKFIEIYIKRDSMSAEEAIEFYDYNVVSGPIRGSRLPIIIDDTGV